MIEVVCNGTYFRDTSGQAQGAFFVLRDATDLRQYQAQMLFQASYDALTALPNRRLFRDRLERSTERTGFSCSPLKWMPRYSAGSISATVCVTR